MERIACRAARARCLSFQNVKCLVRLLSLLSPSLLNGWGALVHTPAWGARPSPPPGAFLQRSQMRFGFPFPDLSLPTFPLTASFPFTTPHQCFAAARHHAPATLSFNLLWVPPAGGAPQALSLLCGGPPRRRCPHTPTPPCPVGDWLGKPALGLPPTPKAQALPPLSRRRRRDSRGGRHCPPPRRRKARACALAAAAAREQGMGFDAPLLRVGRASRPSSLRSPFFLDFSSLFLVGTFLLLPFRLVALHGGRGLFGKTAPPSAWPHAAARGAAPSLDSPPRHLPPPARDCAPSPPLPALLL